MADIPKLGGVPSNTADPNYLNDLADYVAKLEKMVTWFMTGNLSSKNAREFGGWRVGITELMALDGTVGMSTDIAGADPVRFWAGSTLKDSAPWRVHKSGKMVATGALIQSASGYPKVVLDPSSNIFGVYGSATNYIIFKPTINPVFNAPEIGWVNGGSSANIYLAPALLNIQSTTDISIQTTSVLDLEVGAIWVPSWSALKLKAGGQTLPQYINGAISGYTGIVVTPDYNFFYSNGLLKSVT